MSGSTLGCTAYPCDPTIAPMTILDGSNVRNGNGCGSHHGEQCVFTCASGYQAINGDISYTCDTSAQVGTTGRGTWITNSPEGLNLICTGKFVVFSLSSVVTTAGIPMLTIAVLHVFTITEERHCVVNFGNGMEGGDTNPCSDGARLSSSTTCDVKCANYALDSAGNTEQAAGTFACPALGHDNT